MMAAAVALLVVHAVMAYSWLLFPVLLAGVRRKRPETQTEPGFTPRVAVILSAYNEETHIAERIRNLLDLDYPDALLHVYVGVDGARDGTAAAARAAAAGSPNVTVLEFAENRGKVSVLKDLVASAVASPAPPDALVFTDANTTFAAAAVRRLCAPLADAAIGGVCGRLVLVSKGKEETEELPYWRLETWLKTKESAIDSCLGANGAIYVTRSALFWKAIPSNTIIDDFVISMKVREEGYRFVYEPRALAFELLPERIHDEWRRRVRIGAGDFQALRLCAACLKPSYGLFAALFWSHKVLRWFTPHLTVAGLILTAVSAAQGSTIGMAFLLFYAAFAIAAFLGRFWNVRRGRLARIARGLHYLLVMQAAILAGFLRFCRGNLEGRWQRTARQ